MEVPPCKPPLTLCAPPTLPSAAFVLYHVTACHPLRHRTGTSDVCKSPFVPPRRRGWNPGMEVIDSQFSTPVTLALRTLRRRKCKSLSALRNSRPPPPVSPSCLASWGCEDAQLFGCRPEGGVTEGAYVIIHRTFYFYIFFNFFFIFLEKKKQPKKPSSPFALKCSLTSKLMSLFPACEAAS